MTALKNMNKTPDDSGGVRPRKIRALGALAIAAACLGALALAALGAYYGVRLYGASTLGDMEAAIAAPAAMPRATPGETLIHGAIMPNGEFKPIAAVVEKEGGAMPSRSAPSFLDVGDAQDTASSSPSPSATSRADGETPALAVSAPSPAASDSAADLTTATANATDTDAQSAPSAPNIAANGDSGDDDNEASAALAGRALVSSYNSIYPALALHPKYWRSPATAGSDAYSFGAVMRPDGFLSLSADRGAPLGSAPDAAHVAIPSIGVDSAVANLAILDLGDRREYETPDKIVGRIPQKANPGEIGATWLFGHLESPIRGEGDVFRRLPEIPDLLRMGDPVYVEIRNEADDEYLYQITETKVVHQDDLAPHVYGQDAARATITLVACVPRMVYDHRILVIGELVGVKPGDSRFLAAAGARVRQGVAHYGHEVAGGGGHAFALESQYPPLLDRQYVR